MNLREYGPIEARLDQLSIKHQEQSYADFDTNQIFQSLSSENKQLLLPVNSELKFYLSSLSEITRWECHQYQIVVDNLPQKDNDFDHISRMLRTKEQIQDLSISGINYDDIELMILLHDGGEIITGDICQNDPSRLQLDFLKDIEVRSFPAIVLRKLSNQNLPLRFRLNNLYQRYQTRSDRVSDSESHLVKLIDHFDGNSFGMKYVYSREVLSKFYPNGDFPADPEVLIKKIIEAELHQLELFLNSLSSLEDRKKIIVYYRDNWFKNYSNNGYQQISESYEDYLDKLF